MNTEIILKYGPLILAGLSFFGIVYLIGRKIPILLKLPSVAPEGKEHKIFLKTVLLKIGIRIRGLKYSSLQPAIASWAEKTLRKMRVGLLKIDNLFVNLIGRSREKSQIWKVRSRAWMEQHRLKKIQKLQVLEKLDQAEILESIQKAKFEVEEEKKNGALKNESAPIQQEGLKEAGEKECIDAIAQDPRDIEAYRRLGFIYCGQGNKDDAKNCFKQVLKLNPDDLEVVAKMKELAE